MRIILLVLCIMLSLLLISCSESHHKFKRGDIVCTKLRNTKVLILNLSGEYTYNVKIEFKTGEYYRTNLTEFELQECDRSENIKEYQQHEEIKKSL